jgi:hypothetical protein
MGRMEKDCVFNKESLPETHWEEQILRIQIWRAWTKIEKQHFRKYCSLQSSPTDSAPYCFRLPGKAAEVKAGLAVGKTENGRPF